MNKTRTKNYKKWGLEIGDWGLENGDLGLGIGPNTQYTINNNKTPNPQ